MQNIRVLLAVFFPHNVHVNDIVEIDGHRPTRIFLSIPIYWRNFSSVKLCFTEGVSESRKKSKIR